MTTTNVSQPSYHFYAIHRSLLINEFTYLQGLPFINLNVSNQLFENVSVKNSSVYVYVKVKPKPGLAERQRKLQSNKKYDD